MESSEQKKQPLVIKGAIKYTLTEAENGDWNISYESSIENDIVCLSAAQNITQTITNGLRGMVKFEKTTRSKKSLKVLIDKGVAASFGLKMIVDYMQPLYSEYRKKLNEKNS